MEICYSTFYYGAQNGSQSYNDTYYDVYDDVRCIFYYIFPIFSILVCIFGTLGNGMVIWLLGFQIKRNQFTTYILNLAIADFFLLTALNIFICTRDLELIYALFAFFSTSEYFLTVISMDRCISIFFPLWYRCHRPKHLSTIVCALIWVISLLSPAVGFIFYNDGMVVVVNRIIIIFLVTGVFSFILMTISSLILFIKVCCKANQQHKRKILITILIIVFVFLFLCFPVNVLTMATWTTLQDSILVYSAMFCGCLNSSVNPLIYYLVGRKKKRHSKKSMKAALQELFKEEET